MGTLFHSICTWSFSPCRPHPTTHLQPTRNITHNTTQHNTIHTGLWSRLVSSMPYLKGDAPSLLEGNVPAITQAYVSSRCGGREGEMGAGRRGLLGRVMASARPTSAAGA